MYKNVRGGREGLKNIHLITSSPGQRADSEVLINMQGSFLVFFWSRRSEEGVSQPAACQIERRSNGARLHGGHLHRRWLGYLSLQQMVCLMHAAQEGCVTSPRMPSCVLNLIWTTHTHTHTHMRAQTHWGKRRPRWLNQAVRAGKMTILVF